jgi:hydrogenase maturation protein HypF
VTRLQLSVHGIVQGVGFRPFVQREATRRGLTGYVRNARGRVELEIQGEAAELDAFVEKLRALEPPAEVRRLELSQIGEVDEAGFRILDSTADAAVEPALPADLALCAECAREIRDIEDRRYRYPFTNCTRCGPRYSIVEALPYDRARTSLRGFALCPACTTEYENPEDRRFHAEPIACAACGPRLTLLVSGAAVHEGQRALEAAARALRDGRILALKGLGGFQLLVRAADAAAVAELRRRKRRDEKPFAVMFPSLEALRRCTRPSSSELELLTRPEAPIVLIRNCEPEASGLAEGVAPGSPYIGALLPYTPLHALLLDEVGEALVCTSGNVSDEPMCVELDEALMRLNGVADVFLSHDRPIARPIDDSVARVGRAGAQVLRRARGYAPKAVATLPERRTILALGAHQKSSVALLHRGELLAGPHLGDLGNARTEALLERTVDELLVFFEATPEIVACDAHPDYASSRLARRLAERFGAELVPVQHHAAHVASACAEHGLSGSVLGFAWDGSGLGSDGTIWGGEALVVGGGRVERVAHLAPFPLPGGDRAAREPRRSALGLLWRTARDEFRRRGPAWFGERELGLFERALGRGLGAPPCSSVGRLFDAVAALLAVRSVCTFEGQAAIELEALAESAAGEQGAYRLPLSTATPAVADTGVLVRALLGELELGVPSAVIARRFHLAIVAHAVEVAERAGLRRVALSGGCFQNELLARELGARLGALGFEVYSGRGVPCNDGGIAVGQVAFASELGNRRGWKGLRPACA